MKAIVERRTFTVLVERGMIRRPRAVQRTEVRLECGHTRTFPARSAPAHRARCNVCERRS